MATKIIKYYVIFLVIFFSWVSFVNAGIVINEFVSNGEIEWVELLNTGNDSVDLTGWKLIDGNNSNNDDLSLDGLITTNGLIFFESIKGWLNDSGDSIILKDNSGSVIDSVIYGTGGIIKAPLKNKSGALISGNWITNQEPTKNLHNSNINNENIITEENNDSEDIDNTENTSSSSSDEEYIPLKITTKIISPKIVTAGIPFSLNSLTTTNRKETYGVGRFVWNFGNGEIYEVGEAVPFDHIYEYPGEYILTLSYFDSVFSEVADATDRLTIKVIPADIYISSAGDNVNPFIELENKSNYEIILSNWTVTGGIHYFTIPNGTTILPNRKIKLSPKITGFTGEDIKYITITNANKEIVTTYPTIKIQKPTQKNNPTYAIAQNKLPSVENNSQIINLNNLSADAGGANINISKSAYAWIGLIVIVGLGIASFLMIKRKNNYDDYVEKEIRAEDMTIVE